jgi:hypothetical protein
MRVRVSRWHEQSAAAERGPLVFALRRREAWSKVRGEEPYADYEIRTEDPWNYGLVDADVREPEGAFEVRVGEVPAQPWSAAVAPLEIVARGRRVPEWQAYGAAAGPLPWSPIRSQQRDEQVTLVPYGCTKIRISEFPVVV